MRVRYPLAVWLTAALLPMVVLGTSGCAVKQALDEKFTPEPVKVTIEATVAVPGASVEGTLTKGFPETLPLWPGSTVKKSKTTKTAQGKAYSAVLTTPDPYADVLAGVGEGLKTAGWKVSATDASSEEQTDTIIMISNADEEGIVSVSQSAGNPVRIEYIISRKD